MKMLNLSNTVTWNSEIIPYYHFQGADKCDECRNFRDGPFCVESCPNSADRNVYKFADENKVCQPCHANCVGGCNGSANTVGPNGCNLCHVSVANEAETGIVKCLNETEPCPSGYFASRNPPQALSHLKGNTVSMIINILIHHIDMALLS